MSNNNNNNNRKGAMNLKTWTACVAVKYFLKFSLSFAKASDCVDITELVCVSHPDSVMPLIY